MYHLNILLTNKRILLLLARSPAPTLFHQMSGEQDILYIVVALHIHTYIFFSTLECVCYNIDLKFLTIFLKIKSINDKYLSMS